MQRPTEKPDFPSALKLLKSKKFDDALVLLDQMNPTPPVLFAKSSCYLARKRFSEALNAMLSIPVKKRTVEHNERLALCYARVKDYPKAFALYDQMKVKSQNALYDLAYCHCDARNYTTALQLFSQVQHKTVGLLVGIARCNEGQGNIEAAIAIYSNIKEHDVNSLVSYARCFQSRGQFSKAFELLEPIKEKDLEVVLALGRCYSNCNRHNDAISLYSQYLEKNPNNTQIMHEVARCHRDNQEYSTAVSEFNYLLHLLPNDPNILFSLGLCYENMGEFDLAVQTLRRIKQPNGKVQITLGRCLIALERVAEAHAICKEFPHNFYEGQLSFAICLQHMQQFDEAISVLKRIPDWQNNKKILMTLARVYFEQNKLSLMFETLHQVDNWQQDEDVLLAIARAQENMDDLQSAWQTLNSIPVAKRSKTSLAALAGCNAKMGDLGAACNFLCSIPNYEKNPQFLWMLGSYYQEMGQLDKAIDTYKSLKRDDNKTKIALASCHEMSGNFDEMLLCLNLLTPKSKYVLLTIGLAYQRIGLFTQAIQTFQSIQDWASDTEALLALGICHDVWGKHADAITYLTSIQNWQQERKVLLALCRSYQATGDLTKAVESVYKIPSWKNDKHALVALAISYNRNGLYREAAEICLDLVSRFPYFLEGFLCYGKVQLCSGKLNATFIEDCIKKFPYQAGFHQLKALHHIRVKEARRAEETLTSAIKRFPFNYSLYLSLLRHYLYINEQEKAKEIYQTCLDTFRGNPRFARLCTGIMSTSRFMPVWQDVSLSTEIIFHQVELLEPMQAAFSKVTAISEESYIVGSSVLSALERKPLEDKQDIDLVVLTPNLGYFASHVGAQGLVQNTMMKYLFTGTLVAKQPIHLDCYAVTVPVLNDEFLKSNSLSRDFTICCLYLDPKGNVIDPTGLGLQDFRDKILRPIADPNELFAKDPVRILRAIKYFIRGYRPTPDLITALKEWQPSDSLNTTRIAEATRHYLTKNPEQFVQELQRYDLLHRLFGVDSNLSIPEVIKQLQSITNQSASLWSASMLVSRPPSQPENASKFQVKCAIHEAAGKKEAKPVSPNPLEWPVLQANKGKNIAEPQSAPKGVWQKPQATTVWSKPSDKAAGKDSSQGSKGNDAAATRTNRIN